MRDSHAEVLDPVDLDPARLLETATEIAGLTDFGDVDFVEPMTVWLESVAAEGRLTTQGLMGLQAEVPGFLVTRLRFNADLKRHPEILDEDVSDPVVIVGLPRTGSTKLQRILAADPSSSSLPFWQLVQPAPLPEADPNGPDPRIALAYAQLARLEATPEIAAIHPLAAEEADEEYFLLKLTFESMGTMWRARTPSYRTWWQTQPRQRPYDYLRQLVQYLQWQVGGRSGRRMVLKTPSHTGNLDVLYSTFPHATLVQTHRDPSVALASSMRMQEVGRKMSSDHIDFHELGAALLEYFAGEMARNLAQRDLLLPEKQVIDVAFSDICKDVIGVARDIYRRQGRELSAEGEAGMLAWERDNPQHKQGKFRYSLEDYGLTREKVEAEFGNYLARFGSLCG